MGHFSCNKFKGQSLIDYALILAIVTTVMVGMNAYIKRGVQGKIRDMTNFFIGEEHLIQLSKTTSESTTDTTARISKEELSGGGIRFTYLDPEEKLQHSQSVTEESDKFSPQSFVPIDGHIETPERPDDEEFME